MATRLYTNADAAGVTPSSWLGGWNDTTSTTTSTLQGHTAASASTASQAGTGVSGQFRALSRFVSPPLKAQTIDGTVSGVFRASQGAATDDYTLAVGIKVIQSDGTDRGTLLAVVASDDPATHEFALTGSGVSRRLFRDVAESSSISLSSVSVSAGDRIVVEVGFRQGSTSTNNASLALYANSRGDGIADLPFSDGDATNGVPWVEFSADIKFQAPFFLRAISIPEDVAADSGGTNSVSPTTFTQLQLAPARQGDLIIADQHYRSNTAPTISAAAGQSWTSEAEQNLGTTNYRTRNWCTFDGTWDTDLSLTTTNGTANSCQVLIFRAEEATDTWVQDVAQAETEDTTSPFAATAVTTVANEVIVLCSWATPDNNTWSAVSGAGWIDIGSAQYRNLASTDMSDTYAYYWAPTGGTDTGSPSKTQTALGADDTMCLTQAYKRIQGIITLLPSLFTNSNQFFAPNVSRGPVTLTPSLFTDGDTFHSPTVLSSYDLLPSLHTDDDTFFNPTVTPGPVTLLPSLFTDGDQFFNPTVVPGAITLSPALYTDVDSFFSPVVLATYSLTPALFTDGDAFHSPTVTRGAVTLLPSLFSDEDSFFSPTVSQSGGGQTLLPSLFTDGDSFFSPLVTASYDLLPSLFTDDDTFFSPTVSRGAVTLLPSLFTDGDQFFSPLVTPGAVTLNPSLFTDGDTFHLPTVTPGTITLVPSLFTDGDQFFNASVLSTYTLLPTLFTDGDQFFTPLVSASYTLLPSLFTDGDTFFSPTVTGGAANLFPSLFTDGDLFYSPTVTRGAITLLPSLFTDADVFFTPLVSTFNSLAPSLFNDGDLFYSPTVLRGPVTLNPILFTDGDQFFSPTVSPGSVILVPELFLDGDQFYGPTIIPGGVFLLPGLFTDGDQFFSPIVSGGQQAFRRIMIIS
jgi:hypothetical protein